MNQGRMLNFRHVLDAWETPLFEASLREALENLDPAQLPLQENLSRSSYVTDTKPDVLINGITSTAGDIIIRAGIFFSGVIAGSCCSDDPTPVGEENEYCEFQIVLDKKTGNATFTAVNE